MHQSSYHIIEQFRDLIQKHFKDDKVKILDVGSYGVNGTYKDIFSDENKFIYTGLDVQSGPNVDYVAENPYVWSELKDESYDAIISGQAFEHIEFPWLTVQEMSKKLKKNGLICIVAPSRGPEHKYPIDCWRYYPDGFRALAKWAGLEVLETKTFWGSTGFSDGSDQWGDTYCILRKGENGGTIGKPEYRSTAGQRIANKNNPLRSDKADSYYTFARGEVINTIVKNALPAKKILEIGCAGGATGKKLKEILPVDYYVGIEISEQAAVIAKQYLDRVIIADIEKTDLWNDHGLKHGDFDLILVLDVLEHLYNPWDVLADLSEYLKIGGYIVASIPNIQNVTIIKDLIKGKWKYENAGILDATHVRFFTLEEIESMFSGAELFIKRTDYILNPSIDVSSIKEAGNNFNLENLSITNLSKEDILQMFIYQYVVIAKKESDISHDWEFRLKEIEELVPALKIQEKRNDKIAGSEIIHPTLFEKKDIINGLVSIVILTFNQLTYTKECVESIRKQTTEQHEIIFIDNGSTDGTVKWLRQLVKENPDYKLIENDKNLGFAKGCNQGILASTGEYILLLNNDVVITDGWLSGMLDCINSSRDIGIVGPMTNNISGLQKVPVVDYTSIKSLDDYAKSFREKNRYRRVSSGRIVGFCMLFRRELAEKIGLLDESFGTGNFEDDDYCLRASLAGYRNLIAGDVFIHHYGSRSFIGNRIDYSSSMSGNKKIFTEKWSGIEAQSPLGKSLLTANAIDKAYELNQKGEIEEAAKMLLDGIKHSPDDRRVYYMLSEMLIDAKQFKDALDVLNEIPQDDRDVRKLTLIGYCKEGMGLYDEAEEYADHALSLDFTSALAFNLKGILEYKKGEKGKAEGFFEKAIESDPGFGEPYTNIGVLKWTEELRKEALDYFERGFILSPTVTDIVTTYYSAVSALGEFERAERIFQEAKMLHQQNKRIAFLLIDIAMQQGKYDAAMKEIEHAMLTFGIDKDILTAALEVRDRVGVQRISRTSKHKGILSLCMIVKNEEQHIARCLMNAKPVADEIIVVDTGSTDMTKDIAKAFGATVYDFPWTGSFAEARNFSLSKASGDWVLVLDADEVISPLDHPKFQRVVRTRDSKPVAYSFVTRNYIIPVYITGWTANEGIYSNEEAGTGWFPSIKVRLFPNDNRIQFENPVHELVEPSLVRIGIRIKKCDIPVHHYGKLDSEKDICKGEDYYLLGKRKLEKMGENVDALRELAIQAGGLKKYDEAIELWQKVIKLKPDMAIAYLNLASLYLEIDKYSDALTASKKAAEVKPDLKEAVYNYSLCELYAGDVKMSITALENLTKKGPDYPSAKIMLALAYCCDGKKMRGLELFKELKQMNFDFAESIHKFAKKLVSAGRFEYALSLLDVAIGSKNINNDILNLHEECNKYLALCNQCDKTEKR